MNIYNPFKLSAGEVTSTYLADGAVKASKLAAGAVDLSKMNVQHGVWNVGNMTSGKTSNTQIAIALGTDNIAGLLATYSSSNQTRLGAAYLTANGDSGISIASDVTVAPAGLIASVPTAGNVELAVHNYGTSGAAAVNVFYLFWPVG